MSRAQLHEFGEEAQLFYWCQGCEAHHAVPVRGARAWTWNGSLDAPTLSPSVLVRWEHGEARERRVCHTFIRDGVVEFLGDCTHRFAGQKVQMEPVEQALAQHARDGGEGVT